MPTLTEKAKEADKRKTYKITPQIVDLAVAWAHDEVSIGRIKTVLNVHENNKVYAILARALKEHLKEADKLIIHGDFKPAVNVDKPTIVPDIRIPDDTAPSKY